MDEYLKLQKPYYNNGRTAKEQICMGLTDRYDEFISMIEIFIKNSKMDSKSVLDYRQRILNFCANLLAKDFESKEEKVSYFRKLFGELNVKFLFEDSIRDASEARKTTLMILSTGMIFAIKME